MKYIISPQCTTPTKQQLALAANATGMLTVQLASNLNDSIVWTLVQSFNPVGVVLLNLATGTALCVTATDNTTLGLIDLQKLDNHAVWNIASGTAPCAIRPGFDTGRNLNVSGNGPYNPGNAVIAYDGWNSGSPNEVWTFQLVDTSVPYGWFHTITSVCPGPSASTLALAVNNSDPYGNVTVALLNQADDTQLWTPVYYFDGLSQLGIALVNKFTGRALRATGNNALVFTVSLNTLDNESCWTLGGSAPFAVRPAYNSSMNLNLLGSGPYNAGDDIGVWSWGSGDANELWHINLVDSSLEDTEFVVSSNNGYSFCALQSSNATQTCTLQATANTSDILFRLSNLETDSGVSFTVTAPDGTTYNTDSRGNSGVWALQSLNEAGLRSFYCVNPMQGVWTAHIQMSSSTITQWELIGSLNTATSSISAENAFSTLPPGRQEAIYDVMSPPTLSVPPEFCYFCQAQAVVIMGLAVATFVFWAGPVTASSAVVLYAQRLLPVSVATVVSTLNDLYEYWEAGESSWNLARKFCELEGFCQ